MFSWTVTLLHQVCLSSETGEEKWHNTNISMNRKELLHLWYRRNRESLQWLIRKSSFINGLLNYESVARFVILTVIKIQVVVLWVITPCSAVVGYRRFVGLAASITSPWKLKQHYIPRRWCPTSLLHSVTTEKTATFISLLHTHASSFAILWWIYFIWSQVDIIMTYKLDEG